ncbi:MAG TPA: cache domain-containing protein, partial [Anaerolineales bacterium]|nr:cache domain-containing protein [Anaerolineales bacterium]
MILTRKLIFPALIIFAVLLAGIFAYSYFSLHDTYHEAEEADLVSYTDAFLAEIENQKNVALALASTAAGNPEIQKAFSQRNRQQLASLTLPGFETLKSYNVTQYQYYLPDGQRFLSLNDINDQRTGQTLSVVLLSNSEERAVAGLETENGMLGVRGAVPIYDQGIHIGAVEVGIEFNTASLDSLKEKYGGEWHILLSKDLAVDPSSASAPIPELIPYATTQSKVLPNDSSSYTMALEGSTSITHPSVDGRDYAILTSPLRDFSGRIVGTLDIVYDHTHISDTQNRRLLLTALVTILALVLGSVSLIILTTRTLQPIQTLTSTAAAIAEGNITRPIDSRPGEDEIATLTTAFNRMTTQLRNSITDLEKRVTDRTQDLEKQTKWLRLAAEVVRDATYTRNLEEMLNRSTGLILDRFKFYHTGIFLLDNNNEYAVL